MKKHDRRTQYIEQKSAPNENLIKRAPEIAKALRVTKEVLIEQKYPISAWNVEDAADLIEALLRERDALLSDLRGKCSVCKHYSGYHSRGKCKKCIHDPVMSPLDREYITQDHWEWCAPAERM